MRDGANEQVNKIGSTSVGRVRYYVRSAQQPNADIDLTYFRAKKREAA